LDPSSTITLGNTKSRVQNQILAKANVWRFGVFAIGASVLAAPLGNVANTVVLAFLLCAIAYGLFRNPALIGSVPVIAILLMAMWWLLLLAHPNVMSLQAGLLGYRKSIVFIFGILFGIVWVGSISAALRAVWYSLVIVCAASIVLFLFFPSVEASFARAADEYTSLFQGSRRLQGVFAGPFHAALAGSFLVLSSLRIQEIVKSRIIRWCGFGIGVYILILSQVRSGLVAAGIGTIVILLSNRTLSARLRSTFAIAVSILIVIFVLPNTPELVRSFPALESLESAFSDSRLLNREGSWSTALSMIQQSPFLGWGPGSAGATLGNQFMSGGHVTSHNMLLKYAVEGGVFGLALYLIIIGIVIASIISTHDVTRMGLAAIVPMLTFGLIGSTVDALPVSLALAIVFGVSIRIHIGDNTVGTSPMLNRGISQREALLSKRLPSIDKGAGSGPRNGIE
jgi:O-antigen ligase